jgi:hypothetical protein
MNVAINVFMLTVLFIVLVPAVDNALGWWIDKINKLTEIGDE